MGKTGVCVTVFRRNETDTHDECRIYVTTGRHCCNAARCLHHVRKKVPRTSRQLLEPATIGRNAAVAYNQYWKDGPAQINSQRPQTDFSQF